MYCIAFVVVIVYQQIIEICCKGFDDLSLYKVLCVSMIFPRKKTLFLVTVYSMKRSLHNNIGDKSLNPTSLSTFVHVSILVSEFQNHTYPVVMCIWAEVVFMVAQKMRCLRKTYSLRVTKPYTSTKFNKCG